MRDITLPAPDIDFLLASPDPWVRFRVKHDLLGEPAERERTQVLAHPLVRDIWRSVKRWPDGSLGDHRRASDPLNRMHSLADFGLRAHDPGMDALVERVFAEHDAVGLPLSPVLMPKRTEPELRFDIDGQDPLITIAALGYADDPRVVRAAKALVAAALPKGGWVWPDAPSPLPCRKLAGGCPYPTMKLLRLLAHVPELADGRAVRAGTELLLDLWSRRKTEKRYGFAMGRRFLWLRYPFVWFDVLQVLEALSQFPRAWRDPRFHEMLACVTSKADAQGRFTPESIFLEWKATCFGQKQAPSPWLTFVVHRIVARRPKRTRTRRLQPIR